ncbi:hypothetical protein H4R18_002744 [Coemansia javaensis]|uniref:Bet v1-like protein n=1 Tax=Coemansia javaensis TaxID=2761396 RepID=A0A9W8LJK7_9FUNG|nr:hypothetical protein H4R18_002744 [Coemansia javaensis]
MSTTHNTESRVIKAPASKVWEVLRAQDFRFWSLVKCVEFSSTPSDVGGIRTTMFVDGTVQKHRLVELSEVARSLTYEIVESEPAAPSLSAQHTLRVFHVSTDDTAFVQWSSDYSSDSSLETVMDAKFKKLDALAELAKATEN